MRSIYLYTNVINHVPHQMSGIPFPEFKDFTDLVD